jgi:hypothetical protein
MVVSRAFVPIRSPVSDRSALASDREAMMTSVIAGLTGDQIIQLVGRRWVGRTPGDRGALARLQDLSQHKGNLKAMVRCDPRLQFTRADAERYFVAAGGDPEEFDALWRQKRELVIRSDQAVRAGTFSTIGAAVLYVVAGRRPPAP